MPPKRRKSTTTFAPPAKKPKQKRLPFARLARRTEEEDAEASVEVDSDVPEEQVREEGDEDTTEGGEAAEGVQDRKGKGKGKAKGVPKRPEAPVYKLGAFKWVTNAATGQKALGEDGKTQVVCQLCDPDDL